MYRQSKRHKSEAKRSHEIRRKIDRWDNKCGIMDGRPQSTSTGEYVRRGRRRGIVECCDEEGMGYSSKRGVGRECLELQVALFSSLN